MSPLPSNERRALLELARLAVVEAVQSGRLLKIQPKFEFGELRKPSGAFITLRRGRQLRGCIGQVIALNSLAETVAYCAMAAALEDTRFEPVRANELMELEIEISALSPIEPITPEGIVIGKHGLLISDESHRGLLLPQVAGERGWSVERFLQETCAKGGMHPAAWKLPGTRIEAFTAEIFSEAESRAERRAG
ncbi:MAG: AmmeMemoRadiSam system protein A [Candidatus Acidiferrales bacterium]